MKRTKQDRTLSEAELENVTGGSTYSDVVEQFASAVLAQSDDNTSNALTALGELLKRNQNRRK
jgi:hypothetical protein